VAVEVDAIEVAEQAPLISIISDKVRIMEREGIG